MIAIKESGEAVPPCITLALLLILLLDGIVDVMEECGDLRANLACFKAYLKSFSLGHFSFVFDVLVLEIKFRNVLKHPENLSVHLLANIGFFDILEGVLLAHY